MLDQGAGERIVSRVAAIVLCLGTASASGQPALGPRPGPPAVPEVDPTSASAKSWRPSDSILGPNVQPIDLGTALRLAGARNPELLLARGRVVEAAALRQFAAVQFLPSINLGLNYDIHTGNLQQSNGNILAVNRAAIFVGAGSNAVAAGTVNIPGVVLQGNVAEGIFLYLGSRQLVRQREFADLAARNQVLLRVALAYSELTRAEGKRAVAIQIRDDAEQVARITAEYADVGQGRRADADRAATYRAGREADIRRAEGEILVASSRLAALLNLEPSIRFHPTDAWVVPQPVVPEPMPLAELIAIALLRRPELGERRAAIREALLALEGARVLPFSPTVLIGFSAGGFGGGSDLVNPTFGSVAGRSDFDVLAYWTLRNLGAGNRALIQVAKAHADVTRFQELAVLDLIRDEVASAYARSHARFAQIGDNERAVRSGVEGFRLDLERILEAVPENLGEAVRPIEVIDSLRLLDRSMNDYLDAIVDYNRSQFELYVALGQPPAAALSRPVLTGIGVEAGRPTPPPSEAEPPPGLPGPSAAPPPPVVPSPFLMPDRP